MYRLRAEAAHVVSFTGSRSEGSLDTWSLKGTGSTNRERPTIEACTDMHANSYQQDPIQVLSQSSFYQNQKNDQTDGVLRPRIPRFQKKHTTAWTVSREHSLYMKKKSKCLLNHQGRFVRNWDIVTMIGLIYTAIITPVEVAFLDEKVWSCMFWLNQLITLIFVMDMIFQFFLPFETEGLVGIANVTNHRKIAIHYLKGWFLLDLCSVLPLDTIGSATGSESMQRFKIIRFLRLLRLLKMIRLVRASRIFARWQTILAISYTTQSLWKFCVMLTMVAHWISCLWGLVGHEQETYSWVDALEDNKPHGMPLRDPFNLYLASLHFAVMTITSIGYGDIVPQQKLEYIFAIFIQCLGGMLWAYSMGEVMVVVSNLNPASTLFRQRMDELNRMMREKRLPKDMKRRLRSFFLQSKELRQAERYTSLLLQMSPQLQGEVARTTNMKWISKVWYLRPRESDGSGGISDYLIARIAVGLKVRVYAQTEAVRSDDTLNVLTRGLASCHGKLLRAGEIWGEDFVLEHRPLRRLNVVLALTFIEVQELQRNVFQNILEHDASAADYAVIRKAVVWFAFVRGVVLHARLVSVQRRVEEANDHNKVNRADDQIHDDHEASLHPMTSQMSYLRADSRCHTASSVHSYCSGVDPPPSQMTDEFKKEMRAIIRSEMRAVMASHMERLANANTRHGHHARQDPARALPSHYFGDEVETLFRMPTVPPSGLSSPGQP